ncbi:hypothetical protein BKA00_002533 [Actinomadura coerulea]|uniref:Uncharacterized protein n=1 Tax=Actinomadura coerulea TaxID=46159 RepID=A0A7X0FXL3_9ACTN|nr:hypothetical protein [Actinomadura coerulea]
MMNAAPSSETNHCIDLSLDPLLAEGLNVLFAMFDA